MDASLAAYNPQEVTQGLLQALNAVETDRQMRAQRADRAERDLLAGKRIAATEKQYESIISRLPVEDQAAIAASNARIRTLPSETEALIAQSNATAMSAIPVARAAVDQAVATSRVLPTRTDTELAELGVRRGEADTASATSAARRKVAVNLANQQRDLTDAAYLKIAEQIAAQDAAAELASRQGAAALVSFDRDEINRQRAADLDIAVREAQAANLNAQAIERLSAPATTQEDAIKKAQSASTLAKSLRENNVQGERITVLEYMVRTRDANGQPRSGAVLNPSAERQIEAINILESIAQNAILGNDITPTVEKPPSNKPTIRRFNSKGQEITTKQ